MSATLPHQNRKKLALAFAVLLGSCPHRVNAQHKTAEFEVEADHPEDNHRTVVQQGMTVRWVGIANDNGGTRMTASPSIFFEGANPCVSQASPITVPCVTNPNASTQGNHGRYKYKFCPTFSAICAQKTQRTLRVKNDATVTNYDQIIALKGNGKVGPAVYNGDSVRLLKGSDGGDLSVIFNNPQNPPNPCMGDPGSAHVSGPCTIAATSNRSYGFDCAAANPCADPMIHVLDADFALMEEREAQAGFTSYAASPNPSKDLLQLLGDKLVTKINAVVQEDRREGIIP